MEEEDTLTLRLANQEDCRRLWEWANDPDVRNFSFSSEPILWEDHVRWFNLKLNDSNCIIYIALNKQGSEIGQIRYDLINQKDAIISIIVDKEYRHQGYGTKLILLGSDKIFTITNIQTLNAYVKPTNHASRRAFIKAGFQDMGSSTIHGNIAIHLVKSQKITLK